MAVNQLHFNFSNGSTIFSDYSLKLSTRDLKSQTSGLIQPHLFGSSNFDRLRNQISDMSHLIFDLTSIGLKGR